MADFARIAKYVAALYGPDLAPGVSGRLEAICRRYLNRIPKREGTGLSERDALLITYPDQVQTPGVPPLTSLTDFTNTHLGDLVSGIHLLPFFPSSSDDGF